jgi:hypothetical protein
MYSQFLYLQTQTTTLLGLIGHENLRKQKLQNAIPLFFTDGYQSRVALEE